MYDNMSYHISTDVTSPTISYYKSPLDAVVCGVRRSEDGERVDADVNAPIVHNIVVEEVHPAGLVGCQLSAQRLEFCLKPRNLRMDVMRSEKRQGEILPEDVREFLVDG